MRTRIKLAVAGCVAVALLSAVATVAAAGPRHDAIAPVRHATRMFQQVSVAEGAGYAKFTDVNGITCINGPHGQGNMGIHYVNGSFVGDGVVDALHPEAVLYEQTHDGLKLTALEYIVLAADWKGSEPPSLFGHSFMLVTAPNRYGLPNFYALHAWLWKDNPRGRFVPWNVRVRCSGQNVGN